MTILRSRILRWWRPMLAACAFAACAAAACPARADAPREVHGSADAYSDGGVGLAWAVQRGASDGEAQVVLRMVSDDADAAASVAVFGVDPFTQARQPLMPPTRLDAPVEYRAPRTRFADWPRTELHFYREALPAPGAPAALVVYYLGVPDTTPEHVDPRRLDADLAARIDRARRERKGKAP